MAEVLRYRDFSDSFVKVVVPAGKRIKECFEDIKWENHKIFVNGHEAGPDYRIKEKDVVVIRSVPHLTGAAIAVGILAIGAGIAAGVALYKANKAAQKAAAEIEKLKKQTNDGVTNIPYLKGASNSIATGKTQPYIIGTHLFTPYVLNGGGNSYKGYSTISGAYGKRQFYNVVLEGGFNHQILRKMYSDDVLLKSFSDAEPQEGLYSFAADSQFASADSVIEIAQDGNAFTTEAFNKKIVEQQVSDQLKKHPASSADDGGEDDDYEDLYYTLDENAMAADVCILFNGLKQYTSSGSLAERSVEVVPQWSENYALDPENAVWHTFTFDQVKSVDATYTTLKRTLYFETKVTGAAVVGSFDYGKKLLLAKYSTLEDFPAQTEDMSNYSFSGDTIPESGIETSDWNVSVSRKTSKGTGVYAVVITHTVTVLKTPATEDVTASNTFTFKLSRQLRFNAHADIPFSSIYEQAEDDDGSVIWQKKYACPVTIKLSSSTRKLASGSDVSDCYVQWIQSTVADENRSLESGSWVAEKIIGSREAALSTIIGLRIESTTSNEDKLGKISIETSGIAPVYDSENEEWKMNEAETDFERESTANPASWLLEILTSSKHTPSQIDVSEIDLDSFADLYKYCEENALEYNRVITDGIAKSDLFENILSACNAVMYQNIYGKIAVAIDSVRENASFILNEQNLISFKYEKTLARKTDGLKVKYVDAAAGYVENSFIQLYDTSIDPDNRPLNSVLRDLPLTGITDIKQARRAAVRMMRSERLRPKTAKAVIGAEGVYFVPLDKVLVQHPSLKNGLGNSEVRSLITETDEHGITWITGLKLCDKISLESDRTYFMIVQCVSASYCTQRSFEIEGADGLTDMVYFTSASKINASVETVFPHAGDILSYGTDLQTLTSAMTVTAIEPADNRGYTLTLVDYNESIFAEPDLPDFPEYEGHFTTAVKVPSSVPSEVPDDTVTYDVLANAVSEATADVKDEIVEEIETDSFTAYVYSDVTSAGFAVNDSNKTTQAQTVEILCHVIIADEEQEFNFGTPSLPAGWSYTTDYHTIKITVPAGREITSGQIQIPLQYREVISVGELVDENGVAYTDGNGKGYKTYELGTTLLTYNMPFGYTGVKGGRYRGAFNEWDGNRDGDDVVRIVFKAEDSEAWLYSNNFIPGDYFTWTGETTDFTVDGSTPYIWTAVANCVEGAELKKSRVYVFNGLLSEYLWSEDSTVSHNMTAMNDIMDVMETETAKLADNNVVAEAYLSKLVASDAFIDRLVAKSAFVESLKATQGFFDSIESKNGKFTQAEITGAITGTLKLSQGIGFLNKITGANSDSLISKIASIIGNWPYLVSGYKVYLNGVLSIQTESQKISIEPQYFIYLGQGKFGCFGIEIAKKTGGTGTAATYTSGEASSELRLARIYIQDSDLSTLNQLDEYDLFSGSHVYFTDNLKVLYYDLII
ncbi:hypothetical protein [Treponema sp.]|uniref:hypothetical protein n=1 Tax=Treponema sp. TaxID=166 RepID=UPI0025EFA13B|nr:hypothetical protein [Treponema sp.]MCR5219195.1 phage tail protein [Treponema sp.]